ncbi:MAG: SEC-C metal-binding domain-containing protein [Lentisphaeraceae bacterium]|nr:SEC-C metal-binding domain-containing protein [Lentisphaeraceae bacterium]
MSDILVPLFTVDAEVDGKQKDYQVYMSLGGEKAVVLHYFELGKEAINDEGSIRLRFNLSTKNLSAAKTKCELSKTLVGQYRESGQDLREAFYDLIEKEKKALEKAESYVIPDHCKDENWLPFNDILSANGSIAGRGSDCTFQLELGEESYFVEDCYRAFLKDELILLKAYTPANSKQLKIAFDLLVNPAGEVKHVTTHDSTVDADLIYKKISENYLCNEVFFQPRFELLQELGSRREKVQEWKTIAKNIGRNDKCPCGSGKKYKKCCLNVPVFSRPLELSS